MKFVSKTLLEKGWSCDRKYCVESADGTKYLLRFTPEKKNEPLFRMQQKAAELGIPMCRPVTFGKCEEGEYILETWIEGRDAEEVIPFLSRGEQYAYGLEAGRILAVIHSIPAPEGRPDWEARFLAKMDRKIRMYRECPVQFQGSEYILAYMDANRHLLKGRPQTFQHGDYHIGNMMIEDKKLVIIDFDRFDFGDPWEEFNRIVWCAQASPPFASGMVTGYFQGEIPPEFWRLLALYISSNQLSSIPWAIPFGEKEVDIMLKQAGDVLRWYDNMQNPVPTWFQGEC